ncbi:hypothetical protein DFJ73DRAFT_855622, partial [Zopfochytrium polystomum]
MHKVAEVKPDRGRDRAAASLPLPSSASLLQLFLRPPSTLQDEEEDEEHGAEHRTDPHNDNGPATSDFLPSAPATATSSLCRIARAPPTAADAVLSAPTASLPSGTPLPDNDGCASALGSIPAAAAAARPPRIRQPTPFLPTPPTPPSVRCSSDTRRIGAGATTTGRRSVPLPTASPLLPVPTVLSLSDLRRCASGRASVPAGHRAWRPLPDPSDPSQQQPRERRRNSNSNSNRCTVARRNLHCVLDLPVRRLCAVPTTASAIAEGGEEGKEEDPDTGGAAGRPEGRRRADPRAVTDTRRRQVEAKAEQDTHRTKTRRNTRRPCGL